MRIYPAYARTVAQHLVRGNRPACIGVLLSARWFFFDRAAKLCLRPEEWALGRWEFGYLKNEHVVALWGEEAQSAQFGELLLELMLAGPRLLWAASIDGTWLYRETAPDALVRYADEQLTGRRHHGLALRALDAYEDAQLRDLGLVQREAERAAQHGRASVPFIAQRQQALEMTTLLFSDPYATIDDHAA
jgi:hypothetical protein